jgi:hypothetical protein
MFDVFICSPLRGDIEANIKKALFYCDYAANMGFDPFAPHCYYPRFLDELDESDRRKGIMWGLKKIPYCKYVWAFANNYDECSSGMKEEIDEAFKIGVPVIFISPETLMPVGKLAKNG